MKSIRIKILVPVLALAIVALAASIDGIIDANTMLRKAKVISDNYMVSIENVGAMAEGTQKLSRLVYTYIPATTVAERKTIQSTLNEVRADIKNTMTEFESGLDGEEKEKYEKFKDAYENQILTQLDSLEKYIDTDQMGTLILSQGSSLITLMDEIEATLDDLSDVETRLADEAIDDMEASYKSAVASSVACVIISIILFLVAIVICDGWVVRPVIKVKKQLDEIGGLISEGNGDLTLRVESKSNDEVGKLATGINSFLDIMQNIMGKIVTGSTKLDTVITNVGENVATSNDNAQDVSSALEELSATMEEISATIQTVNNNTEEVGNEVVQIADKTEEINEYSKEMNRRADQLAKTANENKSTTNQMIGGIVGTLKQAIEESKSVERVNELTGEILNISSQTNLLALNASIEAARAGEAGKGFAVVADEIRELADSSRDTANNIQAINELVTKAVHELIDNSNQIISYIEDTILPDYDSFVDTGSQYSKDAAFISGVMNEFTEKTERLKELMHDTVDSIDGISGSVEESANAVTTSAQSTTVLVGEMNSIDEQMGDSQTIVADLKKEADVFKKF
jgi:methyl-accepting chemotaxis protein